VNQEIVLSKLSFYGIQGIAEQEFESHLHNRKDQTETKSEKSNLKPTTHTHTISHPEIDYFQNYMNKSYANLNKWFRANQLTLNFDKTHFIKCFINRNILLI
jgi:hypothetical protein